MLLPLLLACSDAPPAACEEGRSAACACADGRSGAQVCADGAWASCVCAGDPDDTDPDGDTADSGDGDTDDTGDDDTGDDDTGDDTADGDTGGDTGTTVRPLQVYLLAGQSNMDGYAYVTGLPPSLQVAQDDVRLYWSGLGAWGDLAPASFGAWYGVEYFGPEVTFGRAVADADPTASVALIKHAVAGTDLASYWYPGTSRHDPAQGPGYRDFLATVDAALAELDAEGTAWEIVGMLWMQGESDAFDLAQAEAYGGRLATFVSRVRADLSAPDMAFAIGKIHCPTCVYGDVVRAGEDEVAATVPGAVAFDTDDLPVFADGIHYDGSGMRTLGERFAQALAGAPLVETAAPAFTLTGGWSTQWTGNYFLGYVFTVDRPITVTDLGTLDYGLDGMAHPSQVALYELASSALVVRGTVPAAYTAPSAPYGPWRFVAVEPTDLEPGAYVLASQVYLGGPELYLYEVGVTAAAGFTWVEGRHKDYASVGLPPIVSTVPGASWFGPNLLYLER